MEKSTSKESHQLSKAFNLPTHNFYLFITIETLSPESWEKQENIRKLPSEQDKLFTAIEKTVEKDYSIKN